MIAATKAHHFTPEAQVLLCCARSRLEPEIASRLRILLEGPIQWAEVFRLGISHGTMPLLYWNLSRSCADRVPEGTLRELQRCFEANRRRNEFFTAELASILCLFQEHHLPCIPFKGPALAVTAYADTALRQFCDLDLLVRADDAAPATELLVARGYRIEIRHGAEYVLRRGDGKVLVEIHWRFFPSDYPRARSFDELLARGQPLSLGGEKANHLSPEDLLWVLCVHSAKHDWRRLDWLCDIAELVRASPHLDWTRVFDQAEADGPPPAAGREPVWLDTLSTVRMLLLALSLAHDFLQAPLPGVVLERIDTERCLRPLAARAMQRLFAEPADSKDRLGLFLLRLRSIDGLRDRVRFSIAVARRHLRGAAA